MDRETKFVYVDQEVGAKLLSLVTEARKLVMVVTPYLKLDQWEHARRAVTQAIGRNVKQRSQATLLRVLQKGHDILNAYRNKHG